MEKLKMLKYYSVRQVRRCWNLFPWGAKIFMITHHALRRVVRYLCGLTVNKYFEILMWLHLFCLHGKTLLVILCFRAVNYISVAIYWGGERPLMIS